MFGIIASARAASRRSALEQDPSTIGTSNVVSSMEGLSGNLPSAGSAPQSGIAGAQEGIIAAGARVAQKQVGMRTPKSVFNEGTIKRAEAIFGDNYQRQASVNGCCEK